MRWTPPAGFRPVKAIAVDNEPVPFWTGHDERKRIEEWKREVGWQKSWGTIEPAGDLNGSSGVWVRDRVISRLKSKDVLLADCLTTYRASAASASRIEDTVLPFSKAHDLPLPLLQSHPSEREIVDEALADHSQRLKNLVKDSSPRRIITLGNAALKVFRDLLQASLPKKLASTAGEYGKAFDVNLPDDMAAPEQGGRTVTVLPLAHPASPPPYQNEHDNWLGDLPGATASGAQSDP